MKPELRRLRSMAFWAFGVVLCIGGQLQAQDNIQFKFSGPDTELHEQLAAASLVQKGKEEGVTDTRDILAAARADYARFLGILYAKGHYSSVIRISVDGREAAQMSPFKAPAHIRDITVTIHPGPVFSFSKAEVTPLETDTELPEDFAPGGPARSVVVGEAANAAINRWRQTGHAKAEPKSQSITANHQQKTLAASIQLHPGPKLNFGKLTQTTPSSVRSNRIKQIADFPEGDVFSPEALDESAKRLRRTGSFSSVVFKEAESPNPDGTLDYTLEIKDQKPRRISFGGEIASDEGLSLKGYWLHRNLFGGAEKFRLYGEISGVGGEDNDIDYILGARIERPATYGSDTIAYAVIEYEREDEDDFLAYRGMLLVGMERIYSDHLKARLGVGIQHNDVQDFLGRRYFNHFILPGVLTYDRRDVELDAKKGYFIEAGAMPFIGLRGAESGAVLTADARAYKSFDEAGRFVLAGRFQLGSIVGADLLDTPPNYLFYSGGGGTVRGKPYESLGVDLGGGNSLGGRAFLGLSGEIRTEVTDSIGIVAFLDAGYIGPESFYDGSGEWQYGTGLGLRYNTPIGPLRFDIGIPLDQQPEDSDFQIYIGIGQAF